MRKFVLALATLSVALPATLVVPTGAAEAKRHYYSRGNYSHHVRRCTHSGGTTGAVAGGVGGALVGHSIFGHGVLGTVGGAVGGAFAGRAVDRSITAHRRCR